MKELIQQKFWVYSRGVEVLLPPHAVSQQAGQNVKESERLWLILNDGTLKKRYPSPKDGLSYMQTVCYERRDALLSLAYEATDTFVKTWQEINPNKPICVVLFGSVAKGLTKYVEHNDPSNIDIAIIGEFTPEETDQFYDAIRPYREKIRQRILEDCKDVHSEEENPGNLGVSIQHISKLSNGHYSGMVNYLGSSAFPLYDPYNMWETIESDALEKLHKKRTTKGTSFAYIKSAEWRKIEKKAREASKKQNQKSQLPPTGVIYRQPSLFDPYTL